MSILRKNRYRALDGWRGIAALMIVFYRFEGLAFTSRLDFVRNAYLFVDYFFVLSGFVIAHTYFLRLRTPLDLRTFMLRRFGRLWPLHAWVFAFFVLLELVRLALGIRSEAGASAFTGVRSLGTMPVELFFLNDFHFYAQTGWNLPSWSIAAEFWVYLIFGLLCLKARRLIVPFAIVIVPLCLVLLRELSPSGMDVTFNYGFLRGIAGFFVGFLTNRIWNVEKIKTLGSKFTASLFEIGSLIVLGFYVSSVGIGPWSLLAPIVFAPMIWIFAFEGGIVSQFLKTRWIKMLGRLSYSIYMVAFLLEIALARLTIGIARRLGSDIVVSVDIHGAQKQAYDLGLPLANELQLLFYVALVLAASRLTYRVLELPARHYFSVKAKRMKPAVTVTEAVR